LNRPVLEPGIIQPMLKKSVHMFNTILIILGITVIVVVVGARLTTQIYASSRTYSVESVPANPVAIVFGAGLLRDGTPTAVLRDRIQTAAELYFSGQVQVLLMSGDNRFVDYNEPGAMRSYAISLGVPEDAIVLDYAGRRTYDTCYRAGQIFGVSQAILVTQDYHLPRAVFICNLLGLQAVGVPADQRVYSAHILWQIRELPATVVALWEVLITKPEPVLGNPEPIFPASPNSNLNNNGPSA